MLATTQMRAAIQANRGGFHTATDQQIQRLWNMLDESTQQQYLTNNNSNQGETDADSIRQEPEDNSNITN